MTIFYTRCCICGSEGPAVRSKHTYNPPAGWCGHRAACQKDEVYACRPSCSRTVMGILSRTGCGHEIISRDFPDLEDVIGPMVEPMKESQL